MIGRPTWIINSKPKKKKSKKKRVLDSPLSAKEEDSNTGLITDDPRLPRNPTSHPKNDKKATKRAKAKERKASKNELDKALAELSIKYICSQSGTLYVLMFIRYPELQNISAATATSATSFNPDQSSLSFLLSVSLPHLDSDTEMRKFFGAKVVSANKSLSSSPSGSSSRKQPGTQRSHLTRPQPSWWRGTQREGLSIRQLTEEQLEDKMDRQSWKPIEEKWWNVEYSKKYKSLTLSFLRDVMSGGEYSYAMGMFMSWS
jgi:hypothetical protein